MVAGSELEAASLRDLIERAIASADEEDDRYWGPVRELQRRADRDTFEQLVRLVGGDSEKGQRLALNVMAQLGGPERPFLEMSLPYIIELCGPERPAGVLEAAVTALGHLGDSRGLSPVLGLVTYPDVDVRFAVAFSLPAITADSPEEPAVSALMALMEDEDVDVRDWATFGLGALMEVDSPTIREALLARVSDPEGDVAGEAIVGLAARRDRRAIDYIASALEWSEVGNLIVEAAALLPDRRYLQALYALRDERWDADDPRGSWLSQAITASEAAVDDQVAHSTD
jgi:HEAT repeat protein